MSRTLYVPRRQVFNEWEKNELRQRQKYFDKYFLTEWMEEESNALETIAAMEAAEEKWMSHGHSLAGFVYSESYVSSLVQSTMKTRRIGPYVGGFRVSYNFSGKIRSKSRAGGYGNDWTCRALYEYLCLEYNNGKFFLDDYFNDSFPGSPAYNKMRSEWNRVRDEIVARRKALLERRKRRSKGHYKTSQKRLESWQAMWVTPTVDASISTDWIGEIKDDVKSCLAAGMINLSPNFISERTKQARKAVSKKGIDINLDARFYASGQFINGLNIFVEADDDKAMEEIWRMNSDFQSDFEDAPIYEATGASPSEYVDDVPF